MEYYYSGTESLWCGNWNHLVCRRCKCKVDHPSQSTEVYLGKKQKWCFLWCPWSQVKQDTSGQDNFRILGCLWTILNRDANCFVPVESKDWNPLCMNTERGGRIRTHRNVDCLLEDFSGKKPRKYCQLETQASWWCHLQSTCLYNQSASSQNIFLRALIVIPNNVSTVTIFKNEGV